MGYVTRFLDTGRARGLFASHDAPEPKGSLVVGLTPTGPTLDIDHYAMPDDPFDIEAAIAISTEVRDREDRIIPFHARIEGFVGRDTSVPTDRLRGTLERIAADTCATLGFRVLVWPDPTKPTGERHQTLPHEHRIYLQFK